MEVKTRFKKVNLFHDFSFSQLKYKYLEIRYNIDIDPICRNVISIYSYLPVINIPSLYRFDQLISKF